MVNKRKALQQALFLKDSRQGQTLLELILAVTLWSLVGVTLLGIFSQGIHLYRRIQITSRLDREAYRLLEYLTKDVENMVSYQGQENPFVARKDRLIFLIPTEEGLQKVGYKLQVPDVKYIHQVVVGRKERPEDRILVDQKSEEAAIREFIRQEEPFFPDGQETFSEDALTSLLSSYIRENSLSFSYAHREGEQIVWQDTWTGEGLPVGVRLNVVLSYKGEELTIDKKILIPAALGK